MLNITITEQTPNNMLRAIRAACNELLGETHSDLTTQAAQHNSRAVELHAAAEVETDKAAACLTAHKAEQATLGAAFDKAESLLEEPAASGAATAAVLSGLASTALAPIPAIPETDSTGAEWNPELHASTKAKNQDGTWKKRRGAGKAEDAPELPSLPPGGPVPPGGPDSPPPLPPTPPAAPLVTMNDIYALIMNGKAVLNDVINAAQAMGFADVGAFSRDATLEQRAQLLQELTA